MKWDSINPVLVEDAGGIAFLRKLVSSSATGWESIGNAYGKPTEVLFQEMIYKLNCRRINTSLYDYRKDKLTDEPVEFFLNMGDIILPEKTINIGLPKIYLETEGNQISALAWSIIFLEPIILTNRNDINFNAEKCTGKVFVNSVYKASSLK